ncbi:uncharacterized protein LOC130990727 [Salvia miltiorrhiza]|uniref:uncharacterized protein LOC130990727 n=1 Tax=Salvia miltiorrhiza TaxID=226208 RepID=UPI0025ACF351|nr:uncharacterized protein LOC130990727 [Salvia miltiorrhiza]
MSCLAWNARGLGSSCAFHEFRRLLAGYSPSIVFVCETKLVTSKCRLWRTQLGYEGIFVVDAVGCKGGLALLWKEQTDVRIVSYSPGHIDCYVTTGGKSWRFTGFYGHPKSSQRKFSWELLKRLSDLMPMEDLPWLVGGDFNEILRDSDKIGGKTRPYSLMEAFRSTIYYCRLHEIAKPDCGYTWTNKRKDEPIFERLDRFLGNATWNTTYTNSAYQALDFFRSDHRPILCRLESTDRNITNFGKGRFHFEDKWFFDKKFTPDFVCEWSSNHYISDLPGRLNRCKEFLEQWAKERFQKMDKKVVKLRKERQLLMRNLGGKSTPQQILEISNQIEKLVEAQTCHWKQRARVNWLAYGDRNSGAFHSQASKRRKKNAIERLHDEHGQVKEEEKDKALIITDYFQKLFSSSRPNMEDIFEVVSKIEERLTCDEVAALEKPYERDEIRRAVFDMHPTKASGPDGFNARFFQRFWPAVGDHVTQSVMAVLNGRDDVEEWNHTLICLIPKIDKPEKVADFRPLSMCNTTYKIVSKVLVNRMRPILGRVIDEAQSAFIKGRLITDNILISFECQHWIRSRKKGRKGYAALKLNMSKAYDRIEWDYLEAILRKLGFPDRLCTLIMRCVRTVSFSFLLNRTVYGVFKPSRGLRQGDPLSPFLFVICAQGFSSLLKHYERRNMISGVPIIPSPNTSAGFEREVMDVLAVKSGEGIQRYLGLPSFSLRNKRLQFGYLLDRVEKKLAGWSQRDFSAGGKEVLIKAVVQAVPTYAMQCFRIPDAICDGIHRLCAGFWWGDKEDKRRMHWARWERLCRPKDKGGMEFRNLKNFNKALLAKQIWRMINNPSSLIARVFKARYFSNRTIMQAKVPSNSSFIWRSLAWSRSVVDAGCIWKVGNGMNISVMNDIWVKDLHGARIKGRDEDSLNGMMVADFINDENDWKVEMLEKHLQPNEIEGVLRTPILEHGEDDRISWKFDHHGRFSVKSAYLLDMDYYSPHPYSSGEDKNIWSRLIWSNSLPPKVKVFIWRAFSNLIPTEANLRAHHVPSDGICCICVDRWGSTEHALIFCPMVRESWKYSRFWNTLCRAKGLTLLDVAEAIWGELEKDDYELWCVMLWSFWTFICKTRHGNGEKTEKPTEHSCVALLEAFKDAQPSYIVDRFVGVKIGKKKWEKPQRGRFRVDVDALFDSHCNVYGAGVIVRNADGKIVVAAMKKLRVMSSVMMGELMAVVQGIIVCVEQDITPFEIYTDSILAARVMANEGEEKQFLPDDLCEILQVARENSLISVNHVYREANMAAH